MALSVSSQVSLSRCEERNDFKLRPCQLLSTPEGVKGQADGKLFTSCLKKGKKKKETGCGLCTVHEQVCVLLHISGVPSKLTKPDQVSFKFFLMQSIRRIEADSQGRNVE